MCPFSEEVRGLLCTTEVHGVPLFLVGVGAVNFHGYQRQSSDLHFWIEATPPNFERLLLVLRDEGFDVNQLPQAVLAREQNISIKISPTWTLS